MKVQVWKHFVGPVVVSLCNAFAWMKTQNLIWLCLLPNAYDNDYHVDDEMEFIMSDSLIYSYLTSKI